MADIGRQSKRANPNATGIDMSLVGDGINPHGTRPWAVASRP
jgi:hypothetical protein